MRNTPTGVGKTQQDNIGNGEGWKHPHGRGEDRPATKCVRPAAETPPRAWGRRLGIDRALYIAGNTPTGVGKTQRQRRNCRFFWKHPHGRGEDRYSNLPSSQ